MKTEVTKEELAEYNYQTMKDKVELIETTRLPDFKIMAMSAKKLPMYDEKVHGWKALLRATITLNTGRIYH